MKRIQSKENQIYKTCKKLLVKKYRDACGQYLVEGEKLFQEALEEDRKIDTVIFSEEYAGETAAVDCPAVVMEKSLFRTLAQTETSQGLIAVVEKEQVSQNSFFERVAVKGGNIVILDRLQDPGNIGTIIRTADAAGYGGIITISGTGDVFSPKIVRAAAGSHFRMPILTEQAGSEVVPLLKSAGKTVIGTCFDTDLCYYNISMKENVALIIGNEGSGISEELLALSDLKIKIPMEGKIDSLNASVAAAILMYESVRQTL